MKTWNMTRAYKQIRQSSKWRFIPNAIWSRVIFHGALFRMHSFNWLNTSNRLTYYLIDGAAPLNLWQWKHELWLVTHNRGMFASSSCAGARGCYGKYNGGCQLYRRHKNVALANLIRSLKEVRTSSLSFIRKMWPLLWTSLTICL